MRNDSENGGQIGFVSGRTRGYESGVLNDDDAGLTFDAPALLAHNFAIAYLEFFFSKGAAPITDTFSVEFVKTWAPKWMENCDKTVQEAF